MRKEEKKNKEAGEEANEEENWKENKEEENEGIIRMMKRRKRRMGCRTRMGREEVRV